MQSNKDAVCDFAMEFLEMEKLTIDQYIYDTTHGKRGNKLTICLLCQLYKLQAAIIVEDEIWFTSGHGRLFDCDVYLGYISPLCYVKYI